MLKQAEVDVEEERLREAVNDLDDGQRRAFYRELKGRIKDPDTYAALNWFFIAGLHHFYLGRWQLGLLDLALFLAGVAMIIGQHPVAGLLLIAGVSLWELGALFRAQIVVQAWNNRVYSRCLEKVRRQGTRGVPR